MKYINKSVWQKKIIFGLFFVVLISFIALGCNNKDKKKRGPLIGDHENAGLLLPEGFEAIVVVDSIGPARHLAIRDNGDIYVKLRTVKGESLVALRDTTGDGKADLIKKFGYLDDFEHRYPTEMKIRNGYLYYSTDLHVYRQKLTLGKLVPESTRETIVIDDHDHGKHGHIAKSLAFDGNGNMFVSFGVPSDTCRDPIRTAGVPGQNPCPELEKHAGVWVFDMNQKDQVQEESGNKNENTHPIGVRYTTGIRSITAMDWNPADQTLYLLQHGRDYLFREWPQYYNRWESAMLPSEEFMKVSEGSNFGWPFCYYDQMRGHRVLNPEYGGDGEIVGQCNEFDEPIIGFPGHFAPNDLQFYQGESFPSRYKNGAFIAFHGSNIRNPYPQAGYFVAFVPFVDGEPAEWEVFANGFAELDPIVNRIEASYRPTGLAVGSDGSLYISDGVKGKIWRIIYKGDRNNFGEQHLMRMKMEKQTASNIKTPHQLEDNLEKNMAIGGREIYSIYCQGCHQGNGQGEEGLFPSLVGNDQWVTGNKKNIISMVIEGTSRMPSHAYLSDEELAEVTTYVRQNFGNNATSITSEEVQEVREMIMNTSN